MGISDLLRRWVKCVRFGGTEQKYTCSKRVYGKFIENVPSTPLDFLNDHVSEFPTDQDFYLHCAGGYRSVIAASILKARGFHKVIDVAGGYGAIKKTGIKRTDVISCSSTN